MKKILMPVCAAGTLNVCYAGAGSRVKRIRVAGLTLWRANAISGAPS